MYKILHVTFQHQDVFTETHYYNNLVVLLYYYIMTIRFSVWIYYTALDSYNIYILDEYCSKKRENSLLKAKKVVVVTNPPSSLQILSIII